MIRKSIIVIFIIILLIPLAHAIPFCNDKSSPYYCEILNSNNEFGDCNSITTDITYYETYCLELGCCCGSISRQGYLKECPYNYVTANTPNCNIVCQGTDPLEETTTTFLSLFNEEIDADTMTRRINEGYELLSPEEKGIMKDIINELIIIRQEAAYSEILGNPESAFNIRRLELHYELEDYIVEPILEVEPTSFRGSSFRMLRHGYTDLKVRNMPDTLVMTEDNRLYYLLSADNDLLDTRDAADFSGVAFGELFVASSATPVSTSRSYKGRWGLGTKRVLVIVANGPTRIPLFDKEAAEKFIFGDSKYSLNNYYKTVSNGRVSLTGEAIEVGLSVDPCDLPTTAHNWEGNIWRMYNLEQESLHSVAKIKGDNAIRNDYDMITILFSDSRCDLSGGSVGPVPVHFLSSDGSRYRDIHIAISINRIGGRCLNCSPQSSIRDYSRNLFIPAHEVGHNFGMDHAGTYVCVDANGRRTPYSDNCFFNEYGDFDNIMGTGRQIAGIGTYMPYAIGWIPDGNIITTTSGTYDIYPIESSLDSGRKYMLRIPVDNDPNYYRGDTDLYWTIEYRRPHDIYYTANTPLQGVNVHMVRAPKTNNVHGWEVVEPHYTMRLDMSTLPTKEGSGHRSTDYQLKKGETFYDNINGVSIEVIEANQQKATIRVDNIVETPQDHSEPHFSYDFNNLAGTDRLVDSSPNNIPAYHYDTIRTDLGLGFEEKSYALIGSQAQNIIQKGGPFSIITRIYVPESIIHGGERKTYSIYFFQGTTSLYITSDGKIHATTNFMNIEEYIDDRERGLEQTFRKNNYFSITISDDIALGWNDIMVVYGGGAYELFVNGKSSGRRDKYGEYSIMAVDDRPISRPAMIATPLSASITQKGFVGVIGSISGYGKALSPSHISDNIGVRPTEPPSETKISPYITMFTAEDIVVMRETPFTVHFHAEPETAVCELTVAGKDTAINMAAGEEVTTRLEFESTEPYGDKTLQVYCENDHGDDMSTTSVRLVECLDSDHCTEGYVCYDNVCILDVYDDIDWSSVHIWVVPYPETIWPEEEVTIEYSITNIDIESEDTSCRLLGYEEKYDWTYFRDIAVDEIISGEITLSYEEILEKGSAGKRDIVIECTQAGEIYERKAEVTLIECSNDADGPSCPRGLLCHMGLCISHDEIEECLCDEDGNRRMDRCSDDERPVCGVGPYNCQCQKIYPYCDVCAECNEHYSCTYDTHDLYCNPTSDYQCSPIRALDTYEIYVEIMCVPGYTGGRSHRKGFYYDIRSSRTTFIALYNCPHESTLNYGAEVRAKVIEGHLHCYLHWEQNTHNGRIRITKCEASPEIST